MLCAGPVWQGPIVQAHIPRTRANFSAWAELLTGPNPLIALCRKPLPGAKTIVAAGCNHLPGGKPVVAAGCNDVPGVEQVVAAGRNDVLRLEQRVAAGRNDMLRAEQVVAAGRNVQIWDSQCLAVSRFGTLRAGPGSFSCGGGIVRGLAFLLRQGVQHRMSGAERKTHKMKMNYTGYFDEGERILRGLTALGVPLNLKYVTKAIYEPLLLDAKAKHQTFELARMGKAGGYTTLRTCRAEAREFLLNLRLYLSAFLGASYSPAWAPLGFINNSLEVPRADAGACQMLDKVSQYFTSNPQFENAAKDYTAAKALTFCTPYTNARTNVEACKFDTRSKRDARDTAIGLLDTKISALRDELGLVLAPTDARWLKFFDRIPGDPRTPEKVEGFTATVQPGLIVLDWDDAARAARYRVLKQIVGVDAEPVLIETVNDSDAQVTGVPAGATVKLQIVPVNGVGPGTPSDVIELQAA